jgi:hypothetical protein
VKKKTTKSETSRKPKIHSEFNVNTVDNENASDLDNCYTLFVTNAPPDAIL